MCLVTSSKLGLRDHVRLFKEVLNAYNSHDVGMDRIALLSVRVYLAASSYHRKI